MRFTEGLWLDQRSIKVHRVHTMWRCDVGDNMIRAIVPCHEIRVMNDTTYGPVLRFTFTSPREDMISVKVSHYTGTSHRGPDFILNADSPDVQIQESEELITMRSGKMELRIQKTGLFGFSFFYDGRFLTSAGDKGTSYITDIDYEGDKRQDYNGREHKPYAKETYIRELLSLSVGEYIYGLGERFTSLVRNGQSLDIWNRDGGSGCDQSYKCIPFYLSSNNYGVLVNTPDKIDFEIATVSTRSVEFSVEGEELEYIVIGAQEPKQVLSKYTALTGRSPVPPAWSFGLWLTTSWMPDSDAEITMDFINGMAERDIPLSIFLFDARWMNDFNCCDFVWAERFGEVRQMLSSIHEKGVQTCVWINPYVSQEGRLFKEGLENNYFLKKADGDIWQTDVWMSGMAVVDFTNPEACKWYSGRLGEIIDMGVDCIKTDFGERIPTDVVYFDGSDPRKMHNYYPYLYNKVIFEMLQEKKGKDNACVFSRSSTVGTQQFPINWGGDNESSYISMAESLRGGLSFCQSGFGFWAHDISGFQGTATPDLYKRWAAFGLLSTHSRLHGMESYRVPWCFDEESSLVLSYFTKLKCALMPYIYAGAVNVHENGIPMMQAMMLAFPEDNTCLTLDMQYMLGDSLLVAPIFSEDGVVQFYVPDSGVWVNYLDGERFEGRHWYTRKYDYFKLPLLVKPNSIIARGSIDNRAVYDYSRDVTFQLFEPSENEKAECRVYDSNGSEKLYAQAEMKDGKLLFTVLGSSKWSVQVMTTRKMSHIKGGKADLREDSVIVLPDNSEVSIDFE